MVLIPGDGRPVVHLSGEEKVLVGVREGSGGGERLRGGEEVFQEEREAPDSPAWNPDD